MTTLGHITEALRRLLTRRDGFTVQLDGRMRAFRTPDELGAFLRDREVATAGMSKRCRVMSVEMLRMELDETRRMRVRLDELQRWCFETGDPIRTGWHQALEASFADEHGWPTLLRALAEPNAASDAYRRVALMRFLRYLESRARVLENEIAAPSRAAVGSWATPVLRDRRERAADDSDPTFTSMRRSSEFSPLPRSESVEIVLRAGEKIPVYLAHRRLRLEASETGWVLRDRSGLEFIISEGRIVIGRAEDCDVVLREAPLDVSRHHLAIEREHHALRLVDLSSFGTFVPRRVLASQSTQ